MPRLRGAPAGNALAIILVLHASDNVGGRTRVHVGLEQEICGEPRDTCDGLGDGTDRCEIGRRFDAPCDWTFRAGVAKTVDGSS
jgi:hypothetical protein